LNVNLLKKYSAIDIDLDKSIIEPKPLKGILHKINLPEYIGLKLTSGVFLSGTNFSNPYEAREYLAITYPPYHKYSVKSVGPVQFSSIVPLMRSGFSRVWPAFGHHGGGTEIVLTEGQLECQLIEKLDSNIKYRNDEFILESTRLKEIPEIIEIYIISSGYSWLSDTITNPSDFSPELKIYDNEGFVIFFLTSGGYECPKDADHRYDWNFREDEWVPMKTTLSCAYVIKDDENLYLKFWGYVWTDCEARRKRYLSIPVIKSDIINITKLKEKLERSAVYDALDDSDFAHIKKTLSQMNKKLLEISRKFKNNIDKDVDLPPLT